MSNKKYSFILWGITRYLTERVMRKYKLDFAQASKLLISSKTYELIEDESTKLWHFSVVFLFKLFEHEQETGLFEMPEVVL